jgi:hypothetical protein
MITITQGGMEFPPRVTIERTAKGEVVYSVTVPDKSVERARKRAEQTFLALKRFAEGLATPEGIDKLARFILEEFPGEPSRSESAVDCAIRLIRTLRATTAPPTHEANPDKITQPEPTARRRRGRPRKAEQKLAEEGHD